MNREKLYEMLVYGQWGKIMGMLSIRDKSSLSCYEASCLALAFAVTNQKMRAKKLLDEIDLDNCGDIDRAVYTEARMTFNIKKDANLVEAGELAEKALDLNPDSIFAKSMLAQIALTLRDYEKGKHLFLEILDKYPEANWVPLQLTRFLMAYHQYSEALRFIPQIRSVGIRILYWFLARVFIPHRLTIMLVSLPLILATPVTTTPYFIALLAVLVIICAYSLIKKEKIIFREFVTLTTVIVALFVFGFSFWS